MDPEIYIIVSKKMASLRELDESYSVTDAYDLLEIISLESDIEYMAHKDAEQE